MLFASKQYDGGNALELLLLYGELDSLSVSPANGWSLRPAPLLCGYAKFICMGNGAAHLNFRQIIAAEFLRGIWNAGEMQSFLVWSSELHRGGFKDPTQSVHGITINTFAVWFIAEN